MGLIYIKLYLYLATLDAYVIARNLLRAKSISLKGSASITSFNLSALLAELKCPYENSDLNNRGNDVIFVQCTTPMFAIKASERGELGSVERGNLERLQALTKVELYKCQC